MREPRRRKRRAAAAAVALAACGACCSSSAAQPAANAVPPPSAAARTLVVTGRGRPPLNEPSKAKQRLMARRAAMVEAYKNVVQELGGASASHPGGGTGAAHAEGFVRGAELRETRYYENGEVEVDVEVPIPPRFGGRAVRMPPVREPAAPGGAVVVEKGGRKISESEWREALRAEGAPAP